MSERRVDRGAVEAIGGGILAESRPREERSARRAGRWAR